MGDGRRRARRRAFLMISSSGSSGRRVSPVPGLQDDIDAHEGVNYEDRFVLSKGVRWTGSRFTCCGLYETSQRIGVFELRDQYRCPRRGRFRGGRHGFTRNDRDGDRRRPHETDRGLLRCAGGFERTRATGRGDRAAPIDGFLSCSNSRAGNDRGPKGRTRKNQSTGLTPDPESTRDGRCRLGRRAGEPRCEREHHLIGRCSRSQPRIAHGAMRRWPSTPNILLRDTFLASARSGGASLLTVIARCP